MCEKATVKKSVCVSLSISLQSGRPHPSTPFCTPPCLLARLPLNSSTCLFPHLSASLHPFPSAQPFHSQSTLLLATPPVFLLAHPTANFGSVIANCRNQIISLGHTDFCLWIIPVYWADGECYFGSSTFLYPLPKSLFPQYKCIHSFCDCS